MLKSLFYQMVFVLLVLLGWVGYSKREQISQGLSSAQVSVNEWWRMTKQATGTDDSVIEITRSGDASNLNASLGGGDWPVVGGPNGAANGSGKGGNSVYKWQDKQGSWHFTSTPPEASVSLNAFEELDLGDSNLSVVRSAIDQAVASGAVNNDNLNAGNLPMIPGIPDPAMVQKLFKDVERIEQLNKNRIQDLDRIIDSK